MSKMTALERSTEVVERGQDRESNTVRKLARKTKYEPISLEQGCHLTPISDSGRIGSINTVAWILLKKT